jgi:DMSO/TMAO reductase YedYZ molybdopterin-dependent catalytic subunit
VVTATFVSPVRQQQIALGGDAENMLVVLGKDRRLIPYGGGNFGMPLELMEPDGDVIVPTERFFMRSNGPVPIVDPETWSMSVTGRVDRPLHLRLDDLQTMPRRTLTAFLECAGNGRTRFVPVPDGTPWSNDAAGNAIWEGVPLHVVLDRAGIHDEAVDVVGQGGDFPEMQRGLPLAVARDPDTLLVLRMNGEPLPVAHGGLVRLLVPGWAGIASTKWLVGLDVQDRAFAGFWNSDNYIFWGADGTPQRPIREMLVKSVISAPLQGAVIEPGSTVIGGYAWSGHGAVAQVEVSVDGGISWGQADLETAGRRSWVRFHYPWTATCGQHRLMARATDERRLRQPKIADWNGKGYGQNGIHCVEVIVDERLPTRTQKTTSRNGLTNVH